MSGVPVLSALESFLSLTNKRETVVATNMANVDTPGYRTQDLDFARELHRAMVQNSNDAGQSGPVVLRKVPNLLERPDGNNVDVDRESLLLSELQLQAQLGTQLMKTHFHQLLTAINSGGQS